jgi:hypothetical protein
MGASSPIGSRSLNEIGLLEYEIFSLLLLMPDGTARRISWRSTKTLPLSTEATVFSAVDAVVVGRTPR